MLNQMTLEQFLGQLSADSPAPGGGSVAALAGSLACALVTMVSRLSGKDEEHREHIAEITEKAEENRFTLMNLIEEDTEAFNTVMAAFKLPKGTDLEKQKRRQEIQRAMKGAADVPFRVMEASLAIMQLADEIVLIGNQNALSDVGVAALMANAAIKGAAYNVRINLLSIKDEEYNLGMAERVKLIITKADEVGNKISAIMDSSLC